MARHSTRRSSKGIFSRLYSPIGHLLSASKESVGAVANTAKGVVGQGLTGLNTIGKSVTTHANGTVRDLLAKRKGGRRSTRRSTRKASRSNRKKTRSSRR